MKPSQYSEKKIETVKISKIKPYHRNVRDNNDEAVEAVKQSITRYGYQNLIIVDKDYVIIAGHTRYKALKALGFKEIEVIVSELSADKAREYRAVDNRTNEYSQWDNVKLQREITSFADNKYFSGLFGSIASQSVQQTDATKWQATDEQVKDAQTKADDRFTETSNRRNAGFVEIPCFHCAKVIAMKRDDLVKRFVFDKRDRLADV